MIDRDLHSILDDAVRDLAERFDIQQDIVSTVSTFSVSKAPNETLYARKIDQRQDHKGSELEEAHTRNRITGNGNSGKLWKLGLGCRLAAVSLSTARQRSAAVRSPRP